jgi:hypothetical protein
VLRRCGGTTKQLAEKEPELRGVLILEGVFSAIRGSLVVDFYLCGAISCLAETYPAQACA